MPFLPGATVRCRCPGRRGGEEPAEQLGRDGVGINDSLDGDPLGDVGENTCNQVGSTQHLIFHQLEEQVVLARVGLIGAGHDPGHMPTLVTRSTCHPPLERNGGTNRSRSSERGQLVREHSSDRVLVEALMVIGYYVATALVLQTLRVDLDYPADMAVVDLAQTNRSHQHPRRARRHRGRRRRPERRGSRGHGPSHASRVVSTTDLPAYTTSKAALTRLAAYTAKEAGSLGVRVNIVEAGLVDTSLGRLASMIKPNRDGTPIPIGRQGTAWDVAAAIVFLLSDSASYITGQTLAVDGGLSAVR